MELDLFLYAVYNTAMGKVTDISKQKRNTSRVNVFIDGEFVCGLDAVTAVASRIKIGDEITAEELKKVVYKSEVNSAFERAVGYISAVPRAKREIQRYLRDKGYDADVCEEAVKRLDDYRYVDDRAYAESYVKSKAKKYGKIRISAELRKKGIDREIIDDVLSDVDEDGIGYAEDEGAVEVARRYLRSHGGVDKMKLKRFLANRGFTWDSVNAAIRILDESGELSAPDDDFDKEYDYE